MPLTMNTASKNIWESDLPLEDVMRYPRQIILPKVKIEGQKALDSARVLVIGMGGLGSPVLMYLATTGIRTIGIVDFDRVELHNLQRQVIHREKMVGIPKVESAGEFVRSLNSTIQIIEHNVFLSSDNASEIIKDYDIVADCCDSVQLRYIINDACRVQKKDLICGSVLRWEGQICVIRKESSCYRCMFPNMKNSAATCDQSGVMGPVCGVIGSLQATEIVKVILENSNPKSSPVLKLITVNCLLNDFRTFQKNYKICSVCETMSIGDILSMACGSGTSQSPVKTLKWTEIIPKIDSYAVVDVRDREHFRMLRVSGSVNIPDVENRIEEIKNFHKPVVVTCYRGNTSKTAAEFLIKNGIEAYSSEGGIESFKDLVFNQQ